MKIIQVQEMGTWFPCAKICGTIGHASIDNNIRCALLKGEISNETKYSFSNDLCKAHFLVR